MALYDEEWFILLVGDLIDERWRNGLPDGMHLTRVFFGRVHHVVH